MPLLNPEIQEEIDNLNKRIEKTSVLEAGAIKKFFAAGSLTEAQESFYEWAFYDLAGWQLHGRIIRFDEGNNNASDMITNASKMLEKIKTEGDWLPAKKLLVNYLGGRDLTFNHADEYGLDRNFHFNGVQIFDERNPETDVRWNTWNDFIDEKLSIIPDKTEPYAYPDIEDLKANIA